MRQQSGVGRLAIEPSVTLSAARDLYVPSRRSDVPSFVAMDVMSAAARIEQSGRRVIHMELGQPAAAPPSAALAAAGAALAGGPLGYTESLGLPRLRRRIARHYHETYGLSVDPKTVIVTTGSSAAFTLAFLALLQATASRSRRRPTRPIATS